MSMRIEITFSNVSNWGNYDVIYMSMRNQIRRTKKGFGERDRLIMSHNERKNYEIRSK